MFTTIFGKTKERFRLCLKYTTALNRHLSLLKKAAVIFAIFMKMAMFLAFFFCILAIWQFLQCFAILIIYFAILQF